MNIFEENKRAIVGLVILIIVGLLITFKGYFTNIGKTDPTVNSSQSLTEKKSIDQGVNTLSKAVVEIICQPDDDPNSLIYGSGIMIDKDGIILTNYHVVEKTTKEPCLIGITNDISRGPDLLYYADYKYANNVNKINSDLDIALLHIVKAVDNNVLPKSFDAIPGIGDADKLRLNDKLYIMGYPGFGGETITFTEGIMSGRIGDNYIKTSAKIDSGNSGGAAFNEKGELIGIPTFLKQGTMEGLGYLTSINPVNEWILSGAKETHNVENESINLTTAGLKQFDQSNYEAALALFNKAIAANQEDVLAWLFKSLCLGYLERYPEALTSIDKTLELSPDLAEGLAIKGILLQATGKMDEAQNYFKLAITADPAMEDKLSSMMQKQEPFITLKEQNTYYRDIKNAYHIYGETSSNCKSITVSATAPDLDIDDTYTLTNYKYGDTSFEYGIREDWNNFAYGTIDYTFTAYCDDASIKSASTSIEFEKPSVSNDTINNQNYSNSSSSSDEIPNDCGSNAHVNTILNQCECDSGYNLNYQTKTCQKLYCGSNAHINTILNSCECDAGYGKDYTANKCTLVHF